MQSIRLALFTGLCALVFFSVAAHARTLDTGSIPDDLKPWIPWVLHDVKEQSDCPFLYNTNNATQCAWPSSLSLKLDQNGGQFTQLWKVYTKSWLALPGSIKHWPQSVELNDKKATVTLHNGKPSLYVDSGNYIIKARLHWDRLPESLSIPVSTGIVILQVEGNQVDFPDLENGKLWIRQRESAVQQQQEDRITFRVFRQIDDSIPMQITTLLQLEVSGKQREVSIGNPLLQGFIPLQLKSRLPARLEQDGLRLQVRPGRWNITLLSRHPQSLDALNMPANVDDWPNSEIWVFKSQTSLRLVEIEGVPSIDPQQTQLPENWRSLPAYQVKTGSEMRFKVIRRGDPQPAPDQLSLKRKLWLHFDGSGYTVQDLITGSKTSGWRLNAQPVLQLGRVLVDGNPQFITTLASQQQGIEVRSGKLDVQAEGLITGDISTLPAVGWDHDFRQVSADLQLPPGWKLFSVSGVDKVPDSWLQRWTLLDLFLVLIITISVARLWSWQWGLFALVTVALLWHEPLAPKWIWLNLLAAIALLRVLPDGKMKKVVNGYRMLVLLSLVILAVPFMVQEVRMGLYPQLENAWMPITPNAGGFVPATVSSKAVPALEESMARSGFDSYSGSQLDSRSYEPEGKFKRKRRESLNQNLLLKEIDPNANVQTGPGLPQWQWRNIPLQWSGPVARTQQVDMVLISPAMNLFLNLLRVVLLLGLAGLMIGLRYKPDKGFSMPSITTPVLAALIALPLLMTAPVDNAHADIPTPELLLELKERLLEKPECLPQCAQIPRMRLVINSQSMELLLEVHALEDVAIPLPGHKAHWLAQEVLINGKPAKGLYRSGEGQLWLDVKKGVSQVTVRGLLPDRNSVQLPLPLQPRFVKPDIKGWRVEGLHEDGISDGQLQLTRIQTESQKAQSVNRLEPGTLPPFVRIERTLRLGLEWQVETTVTRESPVGSAVVIEVPLLSGESVTTEEIRVQDKKVLINMGANQRYVRWNSQLQKSELLTLTAPETSAWSETWRMDISPIWHAEFEGISVIHHTDPGGRWLPSWQPWPGEQVQISLTRPEGVAGQTKTIDQSSIVIKPGLRSTESLLRFRLRSSQGGQHSLVLPSRAELQAVKIDDVTQPIRQKDGQVTIPVRPGQQNIELIWREAGALPVSFRSPQVYLGLNSVNHAVNIQLGSDRWVLLVNGPDMGPAVLFWGELIVILLIAIGLGRVKMTPLRTWHWILLGIGLSQTSIVTAVIVVGWLFAIGWREHMKESVSKTKFNSIQVLLGLLTLVALVNLFGAVEQGLLGYPDMQVSGNLSNAYDLKWYQDRAEALTPSAWVLSVPLLAYRILMLLWSLWLAFALLSWLKWGWQAFSKNGLWQSIEMKFTDKKAKEQPANQTQQPQPPTS